MPREVLLVLVAIAAVLIVLGRLNHGRRAGNLVALAGFAVLALAGVLAILGR